MTGLWWASVDAEGCRQWLATRPAGDPAALDIARGHALVETFREAQAETPRWQRKPDEWRKQAEFLTSLAAGPDQRSDLLRQAMDTLATERLTPEMTAPLVEMARARPDSSADAALRETAARLVSAGKLDQAAEMAAAVSNPELAALLLRGVELRRETTAKGGSR